MRFTPFVLVTLLVVSACHDPTNPCGVVTAPTLTLPRLVANVGASLVPTVTGDAERLTFTVEGGGTLSATEYVARATPGTDRLRVQDASCGGVAELDVEVRPAFDVAPHMARVKPATTITLEVIGLVGTPIIELIENASGATLTGLVYTSGPSEGADTIRVTDDVTFAVATALIEVAADATFSVRPTRIAMPDGSSIPLTIADGSGHVSYEVEGAGAVALGRFALPLGAVGESTITARDVFTGEEVDVRVEALTEPDLSTDVGGGLGAALAIGRLPSTHLALASGQPAFGGGDGRAHVVDLDDTTIATTFTGGASPLSLGREVGADVAFTDFNGDGRLDLVAGAPGLVTPASSDTEALAAYATARAACLTADAQSTGGVRVALGAADGSFTDVYRLFTRRAIAGCVPGDDPSCMRARGGAHVAGGFDVNGDGRQDVAATFGRGVDVVLGVPPDDATLAKHTMLCETHVTLTLPGDARGVEAVGDLDADGCAELAVSYDDGVHAGVVVVFGHDAGGTRCGGQTTSRSVRIAEDTDVERAYAGLGAAVVRAGRVFGAADLDVLAIGATALWVDGVVGAGVAFVDVASIVAARPASGQALRGLSRDALAAHAIAMPVADAFGASLGGGADLDGDGVVDLVVGAPDDDLVGPGAGAAYVLSGGTGLRAAARPEPSLVIAGDVHELGFGRGLATWFVGGRRMLAIGAPDGPGGGAVFTLEPF